MPVWDALRYPLCFPSVVSHDLTTGKLKKEPFKIANRLCQLFWFRSWKVFLIKKRTALVFCHPRRIFADGKKIDPYSYFLFKYLNLKPVFLETHLTGLDGYQYSDWSHSTFLINHMCNFIERLLILNIFTFADSKKLSLALKRFDIDLDAKIINKCARHFFAEFWLYRLLFKILKPKSVGMVVSAGREPIILAAKSLKIPTYEIQHGSPSPAKLNYHYKGLRKESFPDFFFGIDFLTLFSISPSIVASILPSEKVMIILLLRGR